MNQALVEDGFCALVCHWLEVECINISLEESLCNNATDGLEIFPYSHCLISPYDLYKGGYQILILTFEFLATKVLYNSQINAIS